MDDALWWGEIMLVSFWMKLALKEVESANTFFFFYPKNAYLNFGRGLEAASNLMWEMHFIELIGKVCCLGKLC